MFFQGHQITAHHWIAFQLLSLSSLLFLSHLLFATATGNLQPCLLIWSPFTARCLCIRALPPPSPAQLSLPHPPRHRLTQPVLIKLLMMGCLQWQALDLDVKVELKPSLTWGGHNSKRKYIHLYFPISLNTFHYHQRVQMIEEPKEKVW